MTTSANTLARREFLRRASMMGVAGAAAPWALNLSLLGDAAAAAAPGDYKALVCVFLYGGNDYANTLPPLDTDNYATYSRIRGSLTTPQDVLQATALIPTTALPSGMRFALAPQLAPLKTLFDAGRMAVQLNVGPLIQPTTLAQYNARSVPLPPKLFSHNDQQSMWQSDLPEGGTSGWGGRMGDLMLSGNGSGSTFTCISVTGNAVFLSGTSAMQYQVSSNGAVGITGVKSALNGSATAQQALRTLITRERAGWFANEYSRVTSRSIDAEATVTSALASAPALSTVFENNGLANQLKMVARLIAARSSFGVGRQVFMVSLGGFDLHDNLVDNHPGLLSTVGNGMKAFYDATVELGVADKVTAFTASDFGRTLTNNGDGSDHGWGNHHFIVGGAVKGRQFYGRAPVTAVGGPDDVGQGRLFPTTAVDQFAATLASWMGVPDSDLSLVVPGVSAFSERKLGFL
jgi:uncharacterized protein (DUF1501 family)